MISKACLRAIVMHWANDDQICYVVWILSLFTLKPSTVEVDNLHTIRSWEVEYEVVGVKVRKAVETINDPDTTAHILTVDKGTQYRVRVAGQNVQGRKYLSPYTMAATPVDRKWSINCVAQELGSTACCCSCVFKLSGPDIQLELVLLFQSHVVERCSDFMEPIDRHVLEIQGQISANSHI